MAEDRKKKKSRRLRKKEMRIKKSWGGSRKEGIRKIVRMGRKDEKGGRGKGRGLKEERNKKSRSRNREMRKIERGWRGNEKG